MTVPWPPGRTVTLAIGGQTWLELAGLSYSSSTKNIDCARKEHVCGPERLHSIGNRQHASSVLSLLWEDSRQSMLTLSSLMQSMLTLSSMKKSFKSINEVRNAQRRHRKVFVETYHNILSFHAAEDRQQTPGGCPSDHNTTCLFVFIDIWQKIFFFVNVDIVLVCRRPRQLPPMSVQIFTSNLEPVNPSLEKITKRYVLKPNILIGSPPNEETRLDALGFALFGLWYPEFQFDYFPCSTLNHCKCRMDISWS